MAVQSRDRRGRPVIVDRPTLDGAGLGILPSYTDLQPVLQISEVVVGG